MDSSNSSSKKIVFKKGVLASKNALEEAPIEEQEQIQQEADHDTTDVLYEGEVFDQFYRSIAAAGGLEHLQEIARRCHGVPIVSERLSRREREERDAKHQELAEALAHQIYSLAQKSRESDIDLYLSAFNVVLAGRSPQESKLILDRANEFFTEHYYSLIRDRGERPEISHQIIKRVGHEAADKINRIAKGIDVERIAETLWDLYHGPYVDKESRIADIFFECTEAQAQTLRDECMLIPFKSLAKQAHAILNASVAEIKPAARKSIGKGEVYEQKKQAAFKARDDSRALRYLFLGRSSEEMALIKRFYLDIADPEQTEEDPSLDAHVRRHFSQADLDRLGTLLEGWSPHREACEIHDLLYPKTLSEGLDDQLSDPRDVVDRDHTQGIGPFLRRFKKRRMWRDKTSVYHRVLNVREVIAERIAALSPDRFIATNQALYENFGYELDPTMFPSLALFDARRVAVMMAERIPVATSFFELIAPMHFLAPRECFAVQQAYQVVVGTALVDDINGRLDRLGLDLTAQHRSALVERYVNGQGRVALNADITAHYRGEELPPGVWQAEYQSLEEDEQAAIALAATMDYEGEIGSVDKPILEILMERSYDERNRLERAFYDLTDPHISLREALRNCLSPEAFETADLLLMGIDVRSYVAELHDQPTTVFSLQDLAPSQVRAVRKAFEQTYFVSLEDYLANTFSDPSDEDMLIENLAAVLMPEVFEAHSVLQRLSRASVDQVDFVREQCSGSLSRIMAFERGYDIHFPRLRVSIKLAAARMGLTGAAFAELLLSLEGVDPEVTSKILEHFDAVDIQSLLAILRFYKRDQGIIEEAYDLLNPDAQLRRAVKEMKVDLDIINETLLHIDGYSAKDVAAELYELVGSLAGEDLGAAVLHVLAVPTPQRPNPRIPEDINWLDEMCYQIGLAYQREYRHDLIDVCRSADLSAEQLEELTTRIFGAEVCASARELYMLLKGNKEGNTPEELSESRICSYIESRGVRYRARLVRAYNSFWAHHPGFESLLEDIGRFVKDAGIRKKMHTLLLGVVIEPRAAVKSSAAHN
jgi:hypothetical protein